MGYFLPLRREEREEMIFFSGGWMTSFGTDAGKGWRAKGRDVYEALTFAMEDLINEWHAYRRRFEEWLRKK